MTREEYVNICRTCNNKTFDRQKGIVCNLTNNIAAFDTTCVNYSKSAETTNQFNRISSATEEAETDKKDATKNMIFGALWCLGGIAGTLADVGYIFWGAIIFGGIQFFQGLIGYQN